MASATTGVDLSRRAWQRYWQSDRLAACMPDNPAAAAAIERYWKEEFSGLPPGARVLDIATGNGVLLVWAAQRAADRGLALELTGIDAAQIDPLRFVTSQQGALRNVAFHGGVVAESLPFGDAAFDGVVSQFGLEYSDLDASLPEVARVLAPGGCLRWLAHGASSAVVAESAERVAQMDFLLARDGPFAAMTFFTKALMQGRRIVRARDRMQASLEGARAYCLDNPPSELVQQMCSSFMHMATENQRYHPEDIAALVEENSEKMHFYRRRLRDLLAAQLTPEREVRVREYLAVSGWQDVVMHPLADTESGNHLGLVIAATRV
ncbi:MAG: class I SAM-dependent methyltransferase [Chromatocurvus sp.]